MIHVTFRIEGAAEADAFFKRLENGLHDLSGAFSRVHEEIDKEILILFSNAAAGRANPWAPWQPWTESWRRNPPHPEFNAPHYYIRKPGPIDDQIGVWTGQLRTAFMGRGEPGYSTIGPSDLEIGVVAPEDNTHAKYNVFVQGRAGRGGVRSYWVLLNELSHVDTGGPSIFKGAFRVDRGAPWKVYPQSPRPIYENLGLESEGTMNPIVRGFQNWFRDEFGMFDTP